MQLLPVCGTLEIRISHKLLLDACLGQCAVPQELRQSALALLSTAAGASPLHPSARPKLWPSIKSFPGGPMFGCCSPAGLYFCLLQLAQRLNMFIMSTRSVVLRPHDSLTLEGYDTCVWPHIHSVIRTTAAHTTPTRPPPNRSSASLSSWMSRVDFDSVLGMVCYPVVENPACFYTISAG